MLNKFFKFLRGYVIIAVYGKSAERFMNICLHRGVEIWNTVPVDGGISMCIYRRDFYRLREVARKCRVRVRITEKCGFSEKVRLYRKRYVFAAAIGVCVAVMTIMSQFIWLVEINGVKNSDIESIMNTLNSLGIHRGALRYNIPEGNEIKRRIINDTDGISWAWVYIEGAKARVEIYESIIPPDIIDKSTPCDIVAACDGVIKKMVVKSGEEAVHQGDAVSAGDVIVSGKVPVYKEGYEEEYIYVHSMATVEAYTSYTKTGEYKTYYEHRIPTGKHKTRIYAELMGKVFSPPYKEIPYGEYDVSEARRELYIPFFGYTGIALDTVRFDEVEVMNEPISIEVAAEIAKNDLEEKIASELFGESVLTDEVLEYEQTDNETLKVTLKMDFIQNIAVEKTLGEAQNKGEEIFDKQTD